MFKQIIVDNQSKIEKLSIIERDYDFYDDLLKLNKIVSFVWPRRVGKTFLMFQFVKRLLERNVISLKQLVFVDFAQYNNETLDPQGLLDDYFDTNPTDDPFLVFDEIQDIANFKEFVLFFYNKWYRIFLSGSNSKLLSSELSTEFRWRVFQYDVFPLTFKEILRFKNIEAKTRYSTKEKGELGLILDDMMSYGTFPELVLSTNENFKENLLKDYLDILIYKDLLERYKIENEFVVRYLIKRLISSNTKQININRTYNDLKSMNVKVGKNSLYSTLAYLENIFFIRQVSNYFSEKWFKKAFLYNLWFKRTLNMEKDYGKNFENLVFLNLIKKYGNPKYKDAKNEIDFYIEKDQLNIQVCYDLNDENFERETSFWKDATSKNILIVRENSAHSKVPENIEVIHWLEYFLG